MEQARADYDTYVASGEAAEPALGEHHRLQLLQMALENMIFRPLASFSQGPLSTGLTIASLFPCPVSSGASQAGRLPLHFLTLNKAPPYIHYVHVVVPSYDEATSM
jgi:hypothetical protein